MVLGIADAPPRAVVGSHAFPDLIQVADELFRKVGLRIDVEEVHLVHAAQHIIWKAAI